jgi:hypothetical protein
LNDIFFPTKFDFFSYYFRHATLFSTFCQNPLVKYREWVPKPIFLKKTQTAGVLPRASSEPNSNKAHSTLSELWENVMLPIVWMMSWSACSAWSAQDSTWRARSAQRFGDRAGKLHEREMRGAAEP